MPNFNQSLPWLANDPYLPTTGNRINQQYDRWSINDLYLGYGNNLDIDETIDPFLVARCTPHKQQTVDLLSEAISKVNQIDRYREDTYDVKKQVTKSIDRISSVDYYVYAKFTTDNDIWASKYANPQFLYGFYNHTIDGNLLAYPELSEYDLTQSQLSGDYFTYDYHTYPVPLNTVDVGTQSNQSNRPIGTLINYYRDSARYRYIGEFTTYHKYDIQGNAIPRINVLNPLLPFMPRTRTINADNWASRSEYIDGEIVTASELLGIGFRFNYETITTTSLVDI